MINQSYPRTRDKPRVDTTQLEAALRQIRGATTHINPQNLGSGALCFPGRSTVRFGLNRRAPELAVAPTATRPAVRLRRHSAVPFRGIAKWGADEVDGFPRKAPWVPSLGGALCEALALRLSSGHREKGA